MNIDELPLWVKFRWLLLAIAILSWALGFLLALNSNIPKALIIPIFGVIFVWSNGLFWVVEMFYPHRFENNETGRVSRIKNASKFMQIYSYIFFCFYFFIAICFTVSGVKVAIAS